ncbi:hypothetical protein V5074_05310 [Atlantibacter hermannii]|uniref:glycine-rich domain-containing protein n=1 Tax=Atlantibacter hermannii TaxID=565 RepID=UPI0030767BD4
MATNDFKPFATGAGANVMSQADYQALEALITGFQSGKASSAQVNKALRQATFISAALAQFVSDKTNSDVLDNGDLSGFVTKLTNGFAKQYLSRNNPFADIKNDNSIITALQNLNMSDSAGYVGRLLAVKTYYISGSYSPDPRAKKLRVTLTAGGASGGKSGVSGSYARGGGAGGTAISWIDAPSSTVSIVIGAGGVGVNTAGAFGNPGGNSQFGAQTTALGGTTSDGQGGGTSGEGITIFGGNGNAGSAASNNTFGGASYWGGGGAGFSASTPGALSGRSYGSGGAGVDVNAAASGNGAPGICIIEEYA